MSWPLAARAQPLLRQDDRDRLGGHQFLLGQGLGRRRARPAWCAARRRTPPASCSISSRISCAQLRRAAQDLLEPVALVGELLLLAADLHFLELGQVAQPQVEDRLGLDVGEPELLHQDGLRLVLLADDADDLVDIEVGNQQAIEDVQPLVDAFQPEAEPPLDRVDAERQPVLQQAAQVPDGGTAVGTDDVQVHPKRLLEVRGGKQMAHQRIDVHPVGAHGR